MKSTLRDKTGPPSRKSGPTLYGRPWVTLQVTRRLFGRPAAGLVVDLAVGQRLFQVGDARVGHLGVVEMEPLQFSQPLKVYQAGVGDLGFGEVDANNFAFRISVYLGT